MQKTLSRGEWGVTHDDAGRIYRNTNESALHVDFVPTPYFARNPNLLRTRGSYEALADDDERRQHRLAGAPESRHRTARIRSGIDRPDGTLAKFTSVCAPLIYRGDRLPAELYGNAFVAEPAANLVSRIILTTTGRRCGRARRTNRESFWRPPTSASAPSSSRTRPTARSTSSTCTAASSSSAPTSPSTCAITSSRTSSNSRQALGRIYRVVHETTKRDTGTTWPATTTAQLVELPVASERLVARHGPAAARRARRSESVVAGAREARGEREGLPRTRAARALDARRRWTRSTPRR